MKKTLLIGFAALSMAVAAGVGARLGAEKQALEVKADVTHVQDVTKIVLVDNLNWSLRSLWLDNVTLYDGYTRSDFDIFLADIYENSEDTFDPEATTKGYHKYIHDDTLGVNLRAGGDTGTYNFLLPWWVTDFTVQAENKGAKKFYFGSITAPRKWDNNSSELWDSSAWKKQLTLTCQNNDDPTPVAYGASTISAENATYDFGGFTVTKQAVKADGTLIEAIGTDEVNKYFKYAAPAAAYRVGYEFASWKNADLSADYVTGFITAATTIKAVYNVVAVNFYTLVGETPTAGEALTYNIENKQYEGVLSVEANQKFYIRKSVNGTPNNVKTYGCPAELAEKFTTDGDYIKALAAGTYMVYLKDSDGTLWLTNAAPSLVAYVYAGYFLTNIGCDPTGQAVPSGWSDCASRYDALADDVKDYIYGFNVGEAEEGDNIAAMIERYEWAINHNPNSLSHFIVDHEGNARSITPLLSKVVSGTMATSNDSAVIWTVALVSVGIAALLGATFIIRKRRQN